MLVILGSGASAPFGPPTMSKLSKLFEENLKSITVRNPSSDNLQMYRLYKSVKDMIDNVYGYTDIESIFSVIEHLSRNVSYMELGHIAAYLFSQNRVNPREQITSNHQKRYAKKLLTIFKGFVRTKCKIGPSADEHIYDVYNGLFKKLAAKYSYSDIRGSDGRMYGYPACPVYTTNYDLVVETHWQGGVPINDLWVKRSGVDVLDVNKREGEVVDLIKLHGSLNWFKLESGDIVRLESYRRKYGKRRVRGEVMIYPIYQKDLYLYPWFDLFKRFKDDLENKRYEPEYSMKINFKRKGIV
jgi:hypothetical protein